MKRLTGKDMVQALAAQSEASAASKAAIGTGNPLAAVKSGEFEGTGLIRLRVMDVEPYDKNPRNAPNPDYEEIKASIKARGLDQQLSVTKKPGATRYNLARGGKTRLKALQELFTEGEKRFEFIDFVLVEYKSESELLAAHMIENVARAEMTLFDTACGFMDLHAQMQRDFKRDISLRDFSRELSNVGLVISHNKLSVYDFCATYFKGFKTPSLLTFRACTDTFRPMLVGADSCRELLIPQKSSAAFLEKIRQDIAQFDCADGRDVLSTLEEVLLNSIAEQLALKPDELRIALTAISEDSKLTAEELKLLIAEATRPYVDEAAGETGSGTDAFDNGSDDDTLPGGLGNSDESSTADTFDASKIFYQPAERPIETARTENLRILNPGESTGKAKPVLSPTFEATGQQTSLPGLTALEIAKTRFTDALVRLAQVAGIDSHLMKAQLLRYEYYVEIPKEAPLGSSPNDYSVLVWWLLATMSGQFTNINKYTNGFRCVPDGGKDSFCHKLLEGEEAWNATCIELLGGVSDVDAYLILVNLVDPKSDLAEHIIEFLDSMRELNKQLPISNAGGEQ
jgi:ParB family protein of integrating conjugative element (PFGI_1 class)